QSIDAMLLGERDELDRRLSRFVSARRVLRARNPAKQQPRPLVLVTGLDDPTLGAGHDAPIAIEELEHETRRGIDKGIQRELNDLIRKRSPARVVIEIHPLETRLEQM